MITENDKKQYVNYLVAELMDYYNLQQEVAWNAVQSSSAYTMLQKNSETAIWQMHEPFDSTVEEIYDEYKQKKEAIDLFLQRHNPYNPLQPLKFDLRKYASFIEENNLKKEDITAEMIKQFSL